MDYAVIGSAAVLVGTFLVIGLLATRFPMVFKIAIRNFMKRKRSTLFAIFGLAVGAAIVTGTLAVGDSLENAVVESTYKNLGNVDEVVRSGSLFNQTIAETIVLYALQDEIDAVASLMILPASVTNLNLSLTQSRVNLIAFDSNFNDMGKFKLLDGSFFEEPLQSGQVLINEKLADHLGASRYNILNITFRTPEFSFETVYSPITPIEHWHLELTDVVRNTDLGRFQLSSSGTIPENIYVRLDSLQQLLGIGQEVNTLLVSNKGDAKGGLGRSTLVTESLRMIFDEIIGYQDLGFVITATDYVKIDRKEIFFEQRYLDIVENFTSNSPLVEDVSHLTSYFFNWVGNETSFVAYSVAAGFDPVADSAFGLFERSGSSEQIVGEIEDHEAIINEYVADKLGLGEGSTVTLNFSIYDETFDEVYRYEDFMVKYVVNLTGKAYDSELMPPFPGIKGRASCGDWDPPIPVNVRELMDYDDLDYWITYGGSPKVYITLDKAKELWANDLGDITTIKIKPSAGTNVTVLAEWIGNRFNESILHGDAGMVISPVKQEGVDSAEGVQIVTETFIAFGAVVILAGMLLIVLLVATTAEERKREIGIVRTLGASRKKTTLSFVFEGSFLSIIASIIGALLGILLALMSIWLTNTFWSNIVEGNEISFHLAPTTMLLGLVSGFLIALVTYAIASYSMSRMRIVQALRRVSFRVSEKSRLQLPSLSIVLGGLLTVAGFFFTDDSSVLSIVWLMGPVMILMGGGFVTNSWLGTRKGIFATSQISIVYVFAFDIAFLSVFRDPAFLLFFISGFIVVLSASVGWWFAAEGLGAASSLGPVSKIAFSNPSRKPGQSALTIAMFGLVIFTLVALAVNISGQQANIDRAIEEQSGGYQVLIEATTPIRFDLGDPQDRADNGIADLPPSTSVVQFSTYGSPGGTCSNLNSNLPPRLIGANATFLTENSFKFSSSRNHDPSDSEGAWTELNDVQSDGSIPIIGDTNTIVWIYGKGIGDTIHITDEEGQSRKLTVTGILRSSIFSGSVFISEDNLNDLYPTEAEYDLFLVKTDEPHLLATTLEHDLSSYGADATLVEEKVEENLEIEWSYMSLFQTLLLFGLVVGIAGLALTSAKSVSERTHEIGILRSLGFTRDMVQGAFLLENLYISLSGTSLGVIFGLLISYIFFGPVGGQSYGIEIPWLTIFIIVMAVFLATLLSSIGPSTRAARMKTVDALRIEE